MERVATYIRKMTGGEARPPYPGMLSTLAAGTGGALAIAVVAGLAAYTGSNLLMAPFGATCFLAFAVPDSPLAQPRNIVGGHLVASLIGLTCLVILGDGPVALAFAMGAAIAVMQLTHTGHPPAAADPIVIMTIAPGWDFLMFPTLIGVLAIVLVAVLFNNLRRGIRYPRYWW